MHYLKITILYLLLTNTACAQDYQSKNELENEIIGSWHLENSPEDKITFYKDGTVKRYIGEVLRTTSKYEITKECNEEKLFNNGSFLKEINENGISSCAYIEAINYDDNGFFSLMTQSQGKIIVYKKD